MVRIGREAKSLNTLAIPIRRESSRAALVFGSHFSRQGQGASANYGTFFDLGFREGVLLVASSAFALPPLIRWDA